MHIVEVLLNGIDKVKTFNNIVCGYDCDFDLVSGRYVIDAKSIMGTFSLDLSKIIELRIHTEDSNLIADIENKLEAFIIRRQ